MIKGKRKLVVGLIILLILITGCQNKDESLYNFINDNRFIVNKDNLVGAIDPNGKLVVKNIYSFIAGFQNGRSIASKEKNNKNYYGVIDSNGKEIIDFKYDKLTSLNQGKTYLAFFNDKYFIINDHGKTISDEFNEAEVFDDQIYLISTIENDKKLYGLMDSNGAILVKCKYDELKTLTYYPTKHNYIAKTGDKYGLINQNGKELMTFDYDLIVSAYFQDYKINCNSIFVKKDNKLGVFDFDGKEIIPIEYEIGSQDNPIDRIGYVNGYYAVKKNGRYGLVDDKNNQVLNFKYDEIAKDNQSIIAFDKVNSRADYFSLELNKLISVDCMLAYGFNKKGSALIINKSNQYVLIDKKGQVIHNFNTANLSFGLVDQNSNYEVGVLDQNNQKVAIKLVDYQGKDVIKEISLTGYNDASISYYKPIKKYLVSFVGNAEKSQVYDNKGKMIKEFMGSLVYGRYKDKITSVSSIYDNLFKGFILSKQINDKKVYILLNSKLKVVDKVEADSILVDYRDCIIFNSSKGSKLMEYGNYNEIIKAPKGYMFGNII